MTRQDVTPLPFSRIFRLGRNNYRRPTEFRIELSEIITDPKKVRVFLETLTSLLSTLHPRERKALSARFGFDGNKCTYAEVGGALGISDNKAELLTKKGQHHLFSYRQHLGLFSQKMPAEDIEDRLLQMKPMYPFSG